MVMEVVSVRYHSHTVGAVSFDTATGLGAFEYTPEFISRGIELSPIHMPLSSRIYTFPNLDPATFKGLPGLIADSLPDDFGNAVLNAWMSRQGKSVHDITPLQRLQYTGKRGMGALEYSPSTPVKNVNASQPIEVQSLVAIAQEVLNQRTQFALDLSASDDDRESMVALLSVGMSAGGARPKAVLAFNKDFTQVRSGQTDVPKGFTHCLMKFDGVSEYQQGKETFGDPMGYGAMEYVYSLLAKQCGIHMMPCRLLDEGTRRHFVTQRYDRIGNQKVHVQTLNGLAHVSYKQAGSYSYEETFSLARQLRLSAKDAEQLFRRMVFNVVARNHDDHAKNTAFLLDAQHQWQLAPAYDLAYSYKPGSQWVNSHWMTLNGKRDDFIRDDFYSFEKLSPLFSRAKIDAIIDETISHVSAWPTLAKEQGVPSGLLKTVNNHLRLTIK